MVLEELTLQQLEKAASMLRAIAHPTRIAILNFLENGQRKSVSEIFGHLGIGQATASHHLGILRDKGVLISFREGKNNFYSVRHDKLSTLIDCIGNCACEG